MKKIKKDLTGIISNNIKIIGRAPDRRKIYWQCECLLCGRVYESRSDTIKKSISCGCHVGRLITKHGHAKGGFKTRTYNIYNGMLSRCEDKNNKNYGGRGIRVCDYWKESFENFLEDMGEAPIGYSLDRLDNDKGYFKNNCRWATPVEQGNNRRTNVWLEFDGTRYTVAQFSRRFSICDEVVRCAVKTQKSLDELVLKYAK